MKKGATRRTDAVTIGHVTESTSVAVPFRWDLVTPAQLGTLLDGVPQPTLWFLDDLVTCAGRIVARSGGGDLVLVGRSLDSVHDLLSGAFADGAGRTPARPAPRGPRGHEDHPPVSLRRLPVSLRRPPPRMPFDRWRAVAFTPAERRRAYAVLAELGLAPVDLARRRRPVAFADVVSEGNTFTELFHLLREYADEQRAPWDAVRRKIRFVGVTRQERTSPSTWRWEQHAGWTGGVDVVNVSLHPWVWRYLADVQVKLTRTYRPESWSAAVEGPAHDPATRAALAEAVALVDHGRSRAGRRALAAVMRGEPAVRDAWLRQTISRLNG